MVFLRNDGPAFTTTVYFIFETPRYRKEIRRRKWNRKVFVLLFPNPFVTAYCKTCALLHLFFRVVMLLIYGCMCHFRLYYLTKYAKKPFCILQLKRLADRSLCLTMYIYLMYRITILVGTNCILCNCTTEITRWG